MGDVVEYEGEFLGKLYVQENCRYILVLRNAEALTKFLGLNPSDMISIDGHPKPYPEFNERILGRTDIIYTSTEAFLSNELPFPYGRKVIKEVLENLLESHNIPPESLEKTLSQINPIISPTNSIRP